MHRNHPEAALAELHLKFELMLEDYAALKAEVQLLHREAREQHELALFLLRAVAADLAGHRADRGAHAGARVKTQLRLAPRRALSARSGSSQPASR